MHYIRLAGFEGVLLCGCIKIDYALVTALVERWRQETHTFHLPIGEATITLQNVEVLWGLPVDGEPVIGIDDPRSIPEWTYICQELLGITPDPRDFSGVRLKICCLETALQRHLPDDASEEECMQRARVYFLMLLGGHLLSDKSGGLVQLRLLPFLGDLQSAGRYSWGSAVLATLYRYMCDATSPTTQEIAGALVLLQLWAWERLPIIRPDRLLPPTDHHGPYGASLFGNHTLITCFLRFHVTVLPVKTYGSTPAVDTRYPSHEYLQWYQLRTVLYVSNPSRRPVQPEGYQGDDSRQHHMSDMVLRMHHLSIDSLPDAEPAAAQVWTLMRDMTYDTLRGAGELSRLSLRPPPLPVHGLEDHIDTRRIHRTPRNIRGGQHGRGRRCRVRSTDTTDYCARESHDHGEGLSQPTGYGASQSYHHDEGPSQTAPYGVY